MVQLVVTDVRLLLPTVCLNNTGTPFKRFLRYHDPALRGPTFAFVYAVCAAPVLPTFAANVLLTCAGRTDIHILVIRARLRHTAPFQHIAWITLLTPTPSCWTPFLFC